MLSKTHKNQSFSNIIRLFLFASMQIIYYYLYIMAYGQFFNYSIIIQIGL